MSLHEWTMWMENEKERDIVNSEGGQYATLLLDRLSQWTYNNNGVSNQDIATLRFFLQQLFSWDTFGRENNKTGLVPLLSDPYFTALRFFRGRVPLKKYTLMAEPSLYNQNGDAQTRRIQQIQSSGYKIDKRCIIGCDVTESKYFCGCCLRFYCSDEHANKSDKHV